MKVLFRQMASEPKAIFALCPLLRACLKIYHGGKHNVVGDKGAHLMVARKERQQWEQERQKQRERNSGTETKNQNPSISLKGNVMD